MTGPITVPPSSHVPLCRFECSMPIPPRLPETRQTHYDQIIHLLTATVHDLAPNYIDHHVHSTRSRLRASSSASTTSLSDVNGRLSSMPEEDYPRICTKEIETVTTKEPDVVATSKKVFEVIHCSNSHGEVPSLDCEQTLRLSDSGKAKVKLHSDLVSLHAWSSVYTWPNVYAWPSLYT
jgi:hypothetical protein